MSVRRDTAKERMRERLLSELASYIMQSARAGAFGNPIAVERCCIVAGPRAGAVEILTGLDAGKIRKRLVADDSAVLRRAIPWRFSGDPQCYFSGQFLRIEAGWPNELAQRMIRLTQIPHKPDHGDAWIAGKSETGAVIVPHLDDMTPHYLLAGTTGAGKSMALRNAVLQLCQYQENHLVLVDGKFGESLKALERLPGIVGPCAVELFQAKAALAWAIQQMGQRYRNGGDGRVIVVIDEFQELVDDSGIVSMMRQLAAQGRGAHVHLLAATQHPTVDAFGDTTTRRNLTGKVALRVEDPDASRVAVGGRTPRADHLLSGGDSFVIGPGKCHRVQGAFVDETDIDGVLTKANGRAGQWQFESWPAFDPCDLGMGQRGQDYVKNAGNTAEQWSAGEIAAALVAALEGEGRGAMADRAEEQFDTDVGSWRGRRLVKFGRELLEALETGGVTFAVAT